MYKFVAIGFLAVFLALFVVGSASFCHAQFNAASGLEGGVAGNIGATTSSADGVLSPDILCKALYARTREQIAYCEFVIRMRDEKILPNRILYYAFQKALQQEHSRRFFYFQNILELACDKQGIILEDPHSTKTKKFFGFSLPSTESTKPTMPSPAPAPAKPFGFLHKFFAR